LVEIDDLVAEAADGVRVQRCPLRSPERHHWPCRLADPTPQRSIAGQPSEALLGDKGYDSNPNREELRKWRILPVISRKGAPNIQGMGKLRYVVEQTFALLHHFKRLAVRWESRTELHDAFVSLACSLICWRRLKRVRS
jgi:hypothetical protein